MGRQRSVTIAFLWIADATFGKASAYEAELMGASGSSQWLRIYGLLLVMNAHWYVNYIYTLADIMYMNYGDKRNIMITQNVDEVIW
jgi:hypothetical protein